MVTELVKNAFKTSPAEIHLRVLVDWLTYGETTGTVTANEFNSTYFSKDTVKNGLNFIRFKPFVLSDSLRLDNNTRILSTKYENGWMGKTRSDGSGGFSSAEVISMIYDSAHPCTSITISASKYNKLIDFSLYYRNEANTAWILCNDYTSIDKVDTVYDFAAETNIKGWKLEITKIEKSNMFCQVAEVQIGFRDDVSEDVIDLQVEEALTYKDSQSSISIGNLVAKSLNFSLQNVNQYYNYFNSASKVYEYLKPNRPIHVEIGVLTAPEQIEYLTYGTFYLRDIDATSGMIANFYAVDRMFFLNSKDFTSSTVYENYTISDLVKELVEDFGISASEYEIDVTTEQIPYGYFTPAKYASGLKLLSIAEGGVAFFDRDNKFIFKKRNWADGGVVETLNDTVILKGSPSSPLAAGNMRNNITIKATPLTPASTENIFTLHEPITIPAGESKTLPCYFNKQPCVSVANASFTGGAHITKTAEVKYSYGSFITFANSGGADETVTVLTIDGKPLLSEGSMVAVAKDDNLITLYGESAYTIENEFIQKLTYAQELADDLLEEMKLPDAEIEFEIIGMPWLQLGDIIGLNIEKMSIGKKEVIVK